jgi:iron complex transport system ATP-binding protein
MISANQLVFRAGKRALVDHVTATFEPGLLHLIIGVNGAGKSTLLKLLSRLLPPHEGMVSYGNENISRWSERELARRRAVLSQSIEVAFSLPVRELVMMGRYPHFGSTPGAVDEAIVDEVMQYFDLAEFIERDYGTLSGGEKQRVQFARVLAQIWRPLPDSSRYLFLDEPLTFLDIRHQIDFMTRIREFSVQPDVVVVGVVHDLNLASRFGDRLLLLDRGRILTDGPPHQVLASDHLGRAFGVKSALLTNPIDGSPYLIVG